MPGQKKKKDKKPTNKKTVPDHMRRRHTAREMNERTRSSIGVDEPKKTERERKDERGRETLFHAARP